jgi:hypothetical protein
VLARFVDERLLLADMRTRGARKWRKDVEEPALGGIGGVGVAVAGEVSDGAAGQMLQYGCFRGDQAFRDGVAVGRFGEQRRAGETGL